MGANGGWTLVGTEQDSAQNNGWELVGTESPKPSDYAKPGPYATKLGPQDEQKFQSWVKQNKIPWQDSPTADYDMRGYWKAQRAGDQNAKQAANQHFPDTYKTPYHKTFSNESKYAKPNAPHWDGDRLIAENGDVVADETPAFDPQKAAEAELAKSGIPAPARPAIPQPDTMRLLPNPIGGQLGGDVAVSPRAKRAQRESADTENMRASGPALDELLTHPGETAGNMLMPGMGTAGRGAGEVVTGGQEGRLTGALRGIEGLTETGSMLMGPAALESPASLVKGVAIGTGAYQAVGKGADALHLTPKQKQLAQDIAFYLPGFVSSAIGLEGGIERNPAGGVTGVTKAFGGKVGAGFETTPQAFRGAVKVGGTRAGVEVPRAGAEPSPAELPPVSPAQAEAQASTASAIQALSKRQATEQAASVMASGGPIPPPPIAQPPTPEAPKTPISNGHVAPELVEGISKAIQSLPPDKQPQALLEAHQKMSEALLQQGKVIGPDGKLHVVENEKQASKLAQDWLNDKVDEIDAQREEEAKAASKVKSEPATPSKVKAASGKSNGNDWQLLGTDVGSSKEPVIEESRKTVDAQVAALQAGRIPAVFIPSGSGYRPQAPEGMKTVGVDAKHPGGGIYLYDPKQVSASTIRSMAKNGEHGKLLGNLQSKAELNGKPAVIVQAKGKNGTPIQDSAVDASKPEAVQKQAAVLKARHPEATIEVKPVEQVLNERLEATAREQAPSNGAKVSRSTISPEGKSRSIQESQPEQLAESQSGRSRRNQATATTPESRDRAETQPANSQEGSRGAGESRDEQISSQAQSSTFPKGSRVSVSGKAGEVVYASPTMKIARVKFDEGGTRTVGLKEVRAERDVVPGNKDTDVTALKAKYGIGPDVPKAVEHVKSLLGNVAEAEKQYDKLGTPNYVAADKAKELLPGWEKNEHRAELDPAVHAEASRLAYRLFHAKLDRLKPGQDVLLVTGPVAAGKTSATAGEHAALTYEVNLSDFDKASEHIDSIIAKGLEPRILYVYNSPMGSARRRASRMMQDGRPVSITRSVAQHIQLPSTIEKLAEKYGDRVKILIKDNSRHGQGPVDVPLSEIGRLKYNGTVNELLGEQQAELDRLHQAGAITQRVHEALSQTKSGGAVKEGGRESKQSGSGVERADRGQRLSGSEARVESPSSLQSFSKEVESAISSLEDELRQLRADRGKATESGHLAERRRLDARAKEITAKIKALKESVVDRSEEAPTLSLSAADKELADLSSRVETSYRPSQAGKPPVVFMNIPAQALISEGIGHKTWLRTNGMALDIKTTAKAADYLAEVAAKLPKAERKPVLDFREHIMAAFMERPTGGVALVVQDPNRSQFKIERTAKEEQFHVVQRQLGQGEIAEHAPIDELYERPELQKALPYLEKRGYDTSNKTLAVVELAAKLNNGEWNQLGLNDGEAREWSRAWFRGLIAKRMQEPLSQLRPAAGKLLKQAMEEFNATALQSRGNPAGSQEPRSAIGSIFEREGRLGEAGRGDDESAQGNKGGAGKLRSIDDSPLFDRNDDDEITYLHGMTAPLPTPEQLNNFYQADVAPALKTLGIGLKDTAGLFVKTFYPRVEESSAIGRALGLAVPREALDALMEMKGVRAKALNIFDATMRSVEKMFDRIPDSGRVDFVDRLQSGTKQATPELETVASEFRKVMEAMRSEEKRAANLGRAEDNPLALTDKKDYFPNRWQTPPGKDESLKWNGQHAPIRPLQGSKRFLKQQHYTLKSGIAAGGVPVSTNPVRILRIRMTESAQYTTARQAWHELKQLGLRKFIGATEPIPEGYSEIADPIMKVYFPAESGEGLINAGRWVVEGNSARLLNNFLSRDKIREFAIGRGAMALKNITTGIELGLSPFHAVFETIEAASSQLSVGMLRAYNQGIRQADPEQFMKGMKEALGSPLAPIQMAREGAALPAYVRAQHEIRLASQTGNGITKAIQQLREMRQEKSVQRLLKRFPDLDQLVDDMFTGGMQIGQSHDYRTQSLKSIQENLTANNPIGAVLRAIPNATQVLMAPLFNVYIPALKTSLFLRQFTQQLGERSADLESGKLTREELARNVVDRVEGRLGEMDFSNLWLNRTVKTGMQLAFRSATWKIGTARELGGAVAGQSKDLAAWSRDLFGLIKGGALNEESSGTDGDDGSHGGASSKTTGEKALPRLDIRASWALSLLVYTAMLGTIAAKLLSGKYPWEWSEEDGEKGWRKVVSLYHETVNPRSGETDYRGKPVRITMPTYFKDVQHVTSSPAQYLLSSVSGFLSKGFDTLQNRDYADNYVYDPAANLKTKAKQVGKYMLPTPFIKSNFDRAKQQGDSRAAWLSAFGFVSAPRDLDYTPAEKRMQEYLRARHTPETPEQLEHFRHTQELLKSGHASAFATRRAMKAEHLSWQIRLFKKLTFEEALDTYKNYATPEERNQLEPYLQVKRANARRNDPEAEKEAEEEIESVK